LSQNHILEFEEGSDILVRNWLFAGVAADLVTELVFAEEQFVDAFHARGVLEHAEHHGLPLFAIPPIADGALFPLFDLLHQNKY
jgi:hypothetical protein